MIYAGLAERGRRAFDSAANHFGDILIADTEANRLAAGLDNLEPPMLHPNP